MDGKDHPGASGIEEYISSLKNSPRFGPQVVHHQEIPGQTSRFGELAEPLPAALAEALASAGFDKLYHHQVTAIDLIRRGRDVIVSTPTASGKSLIYNLPVFENIMNGGGRALYLFPLKALAQDQLKAVDNLAGFIRGAPPPRVTNNGILGLTNLPSGKRLQGAGDARHRPAMCTGVYEQADNTADSVPCNRLPPRGAICDGDTSSYHRRKIREKLPDILITNPDMLHLSMLGYHDRWSGLWQELSHVIIDEVHTYRGVFGSHMAGVLRRLLRICRHYGSAPRFVMSSATVGNPAELAADLLGREVETVTESTAPRSGRHFIFLNPHDSASHAASQMLEASLKRGLRTIVYTQSRKMTELIYVWTRARLGGEHDKLTSYRAGFLPEERREIETRLSEGSLLGVISTSALELGIDIGELDICILVGYPGTVMATWQRGGRVGRRQRDSLVVMVGQEDALDQYFMRNPANFFNREVEAAVLNPGNIEILKRHLICAAAELPLRIDSALLSSEAARKALAELNNSGDLLLTGDGGTWYTARRYPHRQVDLRGSGRSLAIKEKRSDELLGRIDWLRSMKECHPGGVYLHRGRTWLVDSLDLEGGEIRATRRNVNYFTRPLANKETEILAVLERISVKNGKGGENFQVALGKLRVIETVTGFQRRLVKGHQLIGTEKVDLPPVIFETEGIWIEIPQKLQRRMEREQRHFMGGIHAMEHVLISIFPLLVLCDRNDVGGIAYPFHPTIEGPAVFIYDGHPGGVGLCRQAFEQFAELLKAGLEAVANCPCETGCPSCVHSPKCGSGNRPIDKEAALCLLSWLAGEELSIQRLARLDVLDIGEAAGEANLPAALPAVSRYGVFDVETRRSAAEVGGWHRAERMGISIVVLYDSGPDRFFVYRDDEIGDFIDRLKELDLVIGFNNKRFDNSVLSAYTSFDLTTLPTLDILEEVKNRLGYRISLDGLAGQTLQVKKTADGLMALQWYKEGRIDKIIEYCTKDVAITRDLFLFGRENGYLLFANKAGTSVRCPVTFPG